MSQIYEEDEFSYDEESIYSVALSTIWEETLEDLLRENGIAYEEPQNDFAPCKPHRRHMRRSSLGGMEPSNVIQSAEPLDFMLQPQKSVDWNSTDHTPETVDTTVASPIPQHMMGMDDDEFTFVTCSDDDSFLDESIRSPGGAGSIGTSRRSSNGSCDLDQQYASYSYNYKNDLEHSEERRQSFEKAQALFKKINFVPKKDTDMQLKASGEQRRESFQKIKDFFHSKKDSIKKWRNHSNDDVVEEAEQEIVHFSGFQSRQSFELNQTLFQDNFELKLKRDTGHSEIPTSDALQRRESYRKSRDLGPQDQDQPNARFGLFRSESFKLKKKLVGEEVVQKLQRKPKMEKRFGGFDRSESFKVKKKLVDEEVVQELRGRKVERSSREDRFGGFDRSESFKVKKKLVDKEVVQELRVRKAQRLVLEERFGGFDRSESFKTKKKLVDNEFKTNKLVIGGSTSKSEVEKYGGSRRQERYQKTKNLVQKFATYKQKSKAHSEALAKNEARAEALARTFQEKRDREAAARPVGTQSMSVLDTACAIVASDSSLTASPTSNISMRPSKTNRRSSTGAIPQTTGDSSMFSPTLQEKRLKREMARANLRKSFTDFTKSPALKERQSRRASLPASPFTVKQQDNSNEQGIENQRQRPPETEVPLVDQVDEDLSRLLKTLENSPITMTPRPKLRKAKSNLRNALKGVTLPDLQQTEIVMSA